MKSYRFLFLIFALATTLVRGDSVSCGNLGQPHPKDPCLSGVGANPINPLMGNLHREVTDLQTFGFAPIEFRRIYNSRTTSFNAPYWDFGYKQTWQHNWNYEVRDLSSKTHGIRNVKIRYPEGSEYNFKAADSSGSVRVPTAEKGDRLYPWVGSTVGYTLVTPDGRELDFQRTRSPKYQLVQARDGKGVVVSFEYDADGRLQRIANDFGRWIEIDRAVVGGALCITRIRSHDGREVTYEYETWEPTSSQVLAAVRYPGEETAHYTYVGASTPTTGRPLLASASDPMYGGAGARVRYNYNYDMLFDFGGGPYLVTGVAKEERSLVSDALIVSLPVGTGDDVPVMDGAGAEIRRRFANGLVTEQIDGEGNSTVFTREAEGYGYIVASTDALGATTEFSRDFAGRVVRETDALGGVRETVYNASGFVVSETDELGRVTTTVRNGNNRPIRKDYADGAFEIWTYNSYGQPLTHQRPDGGIVSFAYYGYDESGGYAQDLKSETDALGHSRLYTHHDSGLIESVIDRRGFSTTFAYDWRGNRVESVFADGSRIGAIWDEWGNRVAEIDELGQATLYTYTEFNQVASITDPFDRTAYFEYGRQPDCGSCSYELTLAKEVSRSGRATTHTYDKRGKRTATTAAAGTDLAATTTFDYDGAGRLLATTDPLGRSTTFQYDLLGRRERASDPLGQTTLWSYDLVGNLLEVTQPNGATVAYEYDALGRLTREIGPLGSVVRRSYDANGRISSLVDALGGEVSTVYDLEGRPVSVTNRDGTMQSFGYDEEGNLVERIDELGEKTVFAYDERGRQISKSDPLGRVHSTVLDSGGRVAAEILPSGRRTEYSYDQNDQRIAIVVGAGTPEAASMDFTYDADGRLLSVTDAEGVVEVHAYDSLGRLTVSTDALFRATRFRYDTAGNLLETIRPDDTSITKAYDALNRVESETNAAGQTIRYTYTPAGQVATITDARGLKTRMEYDLAGQMIAKTYSDGNGDTMAYDAIGRLARYTTARGIVSEHTYTVRGQVETVTYNDGTPATASTYDLKGRLTSQTRGSSTLNYVYDAADQLVSEMQSVVGHPLGARTLTYSYNADGFRDSLTYPDGSVLDYSYNARGQLAELRRGSSVLAAYQYRLNGSLAQRSLGNGAREIRHYDAANQLTSVINYDPIDAILTQSHYSLNALGQRTSVNRGTGAVETYGYNAADELVSTDYGSDHTVAYDYDAMGNRLSTTEANSMYALPIGYETNELNQYTQLTLDWPGMQDAPISFAHDLDGNMSEALDMRLSYDGQQQFVSAEPLAASPEAFRLTVEYDARGRRVRESAGMRQSDGQWQVLEEVYYTYDGWNVVEEVATGHQPRRYIWGDDLSGSAQGAGGVGGLVLAESGSETWWYHYDGNGNVMALTDAAGAEIARYRYSPFGQELESDGPASELNPYRFSTKPVGPLGLLYYGHRYYFPLLGRWLNRDPIGERGGFNLYAMVGNDPVNQIDLLGLKGTRPDCKEGQKEKETEEERLKRLCAERERLAAEEGKDPTKWEGPVNYKIGALVGSYGRFEGALVSNEVVPRTASISGNTFGAGVQAGYITGQVERAVWLGNSASDILGGNGAFAQGGAGFGFGPVDLIGVDASIGMHKGPKNADFNSPDASIAWPGVSTTFDPANPASYLEKPKLGFGLGGGVHGFHVTKFEITGDPCAGLK